MHEFFDNEITITKTRAKSSIFFYVSNSSCRDVYDLSIRDPQT